jgi:hypothetical protein
MVHSKTIQFNPTTATYYKRDCDRRIRSAAFVRDSPVTIGVTSDYTQGMQGLEKHELSLPVRNEYIALTIGGRRW